MFDNIVGNFHDKQYWRKQAVTERLFARICTGKDGEAIVYSMDSCSPIPSIRHTKCLGTFAERNQKPEKIDRECKPCVTCGKIVESWIYSECGACMVKDYNPEPHTFAAGDEVELMPFESWSDGTVGKYPRAGGTLTKIIRTCDRVYYGEPQIVVAFDGSHIFWPVRCLRLIKKIEVEPQEADGWESRQQRAIWPHGWSRTIGRGFFTKTIVVAQIDGGWREYADPDYRKYESWAELKAARSAVWAHYNDDAKPKPTDRKDGCGISLPFTTGTDCSK